MLYGLFLLLALVLLQELSVYVQELGLVQKTELGLLSYDESSNSARFLQKSTAVGQFCLGADLPGKDCFSYQETESALFGEFRVSIKDGKVADVTFAKSLDSAFSVVVSESHNGPVPNLEPIVKPVKQEATTKKVVRKRLVENELGEKVEVQEEIEEVVEPDNRSWIQKNWMYIVPPLILFMVMAPEK